MAAKSEYWTRAMLDALPEDGMRHEIIDGVHYVSPSPSLPHQSVVSDLMFALQKYVEREPVGWVFTAPCDIELADDTVVQPDIVVLRRTGDRRPRSWKEGGLPTLAVEVTSPSSARYDRATKGPRYQRARIPQSWIVDPGARLVERWTPGDARPEVLTETLVWHPEGARASLTIDLRRLFDSSAVGDD